MVKNLEYYTKLSYPVLIRKVDEEDETVFLAEIPELPGVATEGRTPNEAMKRVEEAKRGWLEVRLEHGDPIPEPRDLEDFSGRFVVRIPRSLHQELVLKSMAEGVSLNQYVVQTLTKGLYETKLEELKDSIRTLESNIRRAQAHRVIAVWTTSREEEPFGTQLIEWKPRIEWHKGFFPTPKESEVSPDAWDRFFMETLQGRAPVAR